MQHAWQKDLWWLTSHKHKNKVPKVLGPSVVLEFIAACPIPSVESMPSLQFTWSLSATGLPGWTSATAVTYVESCQRWTEAGAREMKSAFWCFFSSMIHQKDPLSAWFSGKFLAANLGACLVVFNTLTVELFANMHKLNIKHRDISRSIVRICTSSTVSLAYNLQSPILGGSYGVDSLNV